MNDSKQTWTEMNKTVALLEYLLISTSVRLGASIY